MGSDGCDHHPAALRRHRRPPDRRYALTGERFGADDARRIGLVHEVVPLAELEAAGAKS
jgi:enoyl-CoA hydratase/carnithine racemase